jgi:hypothetical protein
VLKQKDFKERAEQCRTMAAQTTRPELREQLLEMAASWEQLAEERERLLATKARIAAGE